jgi:predicted O-methyltransferase YrrM
MSDADWDAVDRHLCELLAPADAGLAAALETSDRAGLPAIQVAPNQGKLLALLAQAVEARRVLEVGTLGGYSTIWLARALPPDGRVLTLELDPVHAEVARGNLARAGVGDRVDVVVGPARDALDRLVAERAEPFDLVFIDADKESTLEYFERAVTLSRPGALILVDNVVRAGAVADPARSDPQVEGVRRFLEHVAGDPRVSVTAIQTVGVKGWDGFALARVLPPR